MKQITIYQKNNMSFVIEDDDKSTLEEFSRKLAKLLESSNVSILHTSSGSLVVRPDKISSIFVCESIDDTLSQQLQKAKVEETEEAKEIEEHEGTITD